MIGPVTPGGSFLSVTEYRATPTQPGVRLVAADGTVITARSTSGIATLPAGSLTRGKMLVAPSTAGWYLPMWDDNNGTPWADEVVLVSQDAVATVAITSTVLTTTPTEFYIKQHDTREPITIQFQEEDGSIVDLTNVTETRVLMRKGTEALVVNDTTHGAIQSPATAGRVTYQWQPGDTSTAGSFSMEVQFTFSDGRVLTAPTRGFLTIHVEPDLGP